MTVTQLLQQGDQLSVQGDFATAKTCYQRALALDSHCTEAWNSLGLLLMSEQHFEEAVPYFEQAIVLKLGNVLAHNNLASAFLKLGHFAKAIVQYEYALAMYPNQAIRDNLVQALLRLGNHYHTQDRLVDADACYRRILIFDPDHRESHIQIGILALAKGDLASAAERCRCVVDRDKVSFGDMQRLGAEHYHQGRTLESFAYFVHVAAAQPDLSGHYNNLGLVVTKLGYEHHAVRCYKQALAIQEEGVTYSNLGTALHKIGRLQEAEQCFRRVVEMQPDSAHSHYALAFNLTAQTRFPEALSHFEIAANRRPTGDTEVLYHFTRGWVWLSQGNMEGWREQAWYWYQKKYREFFFLERKLPRTELTDFLIHKEPWNGVDCIAGKRLLVITGWEGFGDDIQMIRCVRHLIAVCGHVTLVCRPALVELFRTFDLIDSVRSIADPTLSVDFDEYVPLMSLPSIFHLHCSMVFMGKFVPYLTVPRVVQDEWFNIIKKYTNTSKYKKINIGLCWTSSDRNKSHEARYINNIELLWPLFDIQGTQFFSLQIGIDINTTSRFPPGKICNVGHKIHSFMDASAALSHLDLLITIDSAYTHLSGALGRPVWLLLPIVSEFRWLHDRSDSPWYPSVRIFRQRELNNWSTVIDDVSIELSKLVNSV
ncbi:MAG: tetratricopeptide repeat protein [Magnetococcales bacterium]|nr:tetratricopeptide repeat protein [Magnetococcales bacterium]